MKRILALVLAFIMLTVVFASCGNNNTDDEKSNDVENQIENENSKESEKNTDKSTEKTENPDNTENTGTTENTDNTGNVDNTENGGNDENNTEEDNQNGGEQVEVKPEVLYVRDGDKVTFGSYPQTLVTEVSLKSTLDGKAGNLPTASQPNNWTSYGYYQATVKVDYMWYIDIEEAGEKYRGVYFNSYRPCGINDPSSDTASRQDDNGYTVETVYWFKYEPISWTILKEDTANGSALIFCDMIIDSQGYQNEYVQNMKDYNNYNTSEGVPNGIYANNYKYSTVRKWLNDTFMNTAFNKYEAELIITTNVDNSASTTSAAVNGNACENTDDKIFLLSYRDILNSEYGFASNQYSSDAARIKKNTDYACAQGAWSNADGNGSWILRSPDNGGTATVRCITDNGYDFSLVSVKNVDRGIVPALQIKFE